MEGGRERGREGEREGGREGGRERGREGDCTLKRFLDTVCTTLEIHTYYTIMCKDVGDRQEQGARVSSVNCTAIPFHCNTAFVLTPVLPPPLLPSTQTALTFALKQRSLNCFSFSFTSSLVMHTVIRTRSTAEGRKEEWSTQRDGG